MLGIDKLEAWMIAHEICEMIGQKGDYFIARQSSNHPMGYPNHGVILYSRYVSGGAYQYVVEIDIHMKDMQIHLRTYKPVKHYFYELADPDCIKRMAKIVKDIVATMQLDRCTNPFWGSKYRNTPPYISSEFKKSF